ncbi:MAG: hypothetical protein ABI581_14810 [Sediminibacterium sp.]
MGRLKKIIRIVVLTLFIVIAAAGAGLSGFILINRERFRNNEVKIERMDSDRKKEEDEGEEESRS